MKGRDMSIFDMNKRFSIPILVLGAGLLLAAPAASQTLCPDGSYVSQGPCQLCPDGSYISGIGYHPDGGSEDLVCLFPLQPHQL